MADINLSNGISKYADLVTFAAEATSNWSKRNEQMKGWYKLIQQTDELAQSGMESFVGNDPRSSFNLILHMLDTKVPHRIPNEFVDQSLMVPAGEVERLLRVAWSDVHKSHRKTGRQTWMRTFLSFILSTGWYAVFAQVVPDGTRCMAEIWNPATVYPDWDSVMWRCVHRYDMKKGAVKRLVARNQWNLTKDIQAKNIILDVWYLDDAGNPHNVVGINQEIAKPDTAETRFNLTGIPIFTGPCGGLPDDGSITNDSDAFYKEIGQSIVATNEHIYKSWNRWWTFSMQLLRDTAQPRWFEKSRGDQILNPENLFRRGGIFRGTPEDSIEALDVPSVPVELRGNQLDMEAMMERGGVSWAAQGNFRGQLTSYVMAQVIASTAQVARPFHQTTMDVLTDIDNLWLTMIREHNAKPYEIELPEEITPEIEASAHYEIKIPGDFIQRANAAKIVNPNYRLSNQYITEELFPEVLNPTREMAKVRMDDAQAHPINAEIALIRHLQLEAESCRQAGDTESARMFDAAAASTQARMEQEFGPQGQGQGQQGGQGASMGGPGGMGAAEVAGEEQMPGLNSATIPPESPRA